MKKDTEYLVTDAKLVRLPDIKYNNDDNDITVTRRFQNRLDVPVRISNRDGVTFLINPARACPVCEFRVYVSYTGRKDVIKNCIALLNASKNVSNLRHTLYRAFERTNAQTDAKHCTATVEYVVTQEQINNSGGRLYLSDLDVLLELTTVSAKAHPLSDDGIDRMRIDSLMPTCSEKTSAFMFKAVDNTGKRTFSDRYINIGGNVYQIPIEHDDRYSTGISVISRKSVDITEIEHSTTNAMVTTFYTFEEADAKYGLYTSIEAAKAAGPIAEAMKEQASIQLMRDKLISIGEERELQVLRNQQAAMKIETDLLLNPGKTFLEYAKVGGAVLTAVVGVLTIIIKLKA